MALNETTRRELLSESSTSDGATLYLVLEGMSREATMEDILVEIRSEMHLFDIVRGTVSRAELAQYRLFTNRAPAERLAQQRIDAAKAGDYT